MQTTPAILRGTFWSFSGITANYIFGFVIAIFLAKWLGPVEYGLIPLVLSVIALFQIFADFGITTSTGKYVAEYLAIKPILVRSCIKQAFILRMIFCIVAAMICFFSSGLIANVMHNPSLAVLFKAASFIIIFTGVISMAESIFRGFQRLEFFALSRIIANITKFVAILILVFFLQWETLGVIWGINISLILTAFIICIILYHLFFKALSVSPGLVYGTILKYSLPLFISAVAYFTYTQVDILVIGLFRNSAEVAYYNIANSIFMAALAGIISFTAALAPVVTKHYAKRDYAFLQRIFKTSQQLVLIYIFPVAFGLFFIAHPLISTLLPRYVSSIRLLQILSPLLILKAVGIICAVGFLTPTGLAGIVARLTTLGAIANIILDILLVPIYGALGAVVVTVGVHSVVVIATIYCTIKKLNLSLKLEFRKSLISSAIMILLMQLYSHFLNITYNIFFLCLMIFIGICTYMISMLALGGIRKADIALTKSLFRDKLV